MQTKKRFIIILLLIGLIPFVIVSIIGYFSTYSALKDDAYNVLETVRTAKLSQLKSYIEEELNKVEYFADRYYIQSALNSYNKDNSPNKINKFFSGMDHLVEKHTYLEKMHFSNIYVVDIAGNIIYSKNKQADFATNLINGKYKNTHLAKAFVQGRKGSTIKDFDHYPLSSEPVAFFACPILEDRNPDKLQGVVITQITPEYLSKILTEYTNLGKTGAIYLLRPDYSLNTKSISDINNPFKHNLLLSSEETNKTFTENSGTKFFNDIKGNKILISYVKFYFKDLYWIIIAKEDSSEIFEKVNNYNNTVFILALLLLILLSCIALYWYKLESQLKTSQQSYKSLVEAVEGLIVVCSRDLTVEFMNPHLIKRTGYNAVGEKCYKVLHDIDAPCSWCENETIYKGEMVKTDLFSSKDNRWYHLVSVPMRNENGALSRLALFQDITEKKILELELAEEHRNLEENVRIRTQELKESLIKCEEINKELEEANVHKNKFLSSLSHELRTPLNSVIGFSDLLSKQYYGPLNSDQSGYVEMIKNSGNYLLDLINDLLDIAKIDAGKMVLKIEAFSLEELINEVKEMMIQQFKARQLKINTFFDPSITLISSDKRRLKQIMFNLLSNAEKYTPEGGSVDIVTEKINDGFIKVSVKDTGGGIPFCHINKVFDDFYQIDNLQDRISSGLGIGLALTRRLVELHGGNIAVESEPDKGTTFYFTLPM